MNRLHLVLDPDVVGDVRFFRVLPTIAAAVRGRPITVQLRIKTNYERFERAAPFFSEVVNNCGTTSFDGPRHYPEAALPIRRNHGLSGASVHDLSSLKAARGADYVFFGPVFDAGSKPVLGVGLEALAEVVREATVPVIAIGGVTPDRVAACRAAGAYGVATLTHVLEAADPSVVIQQFCRALEESCRI